MARRRHVERGGKKASVTAARTGTENPADRGIPPRGASDRHVLQRHPWLLQGIRLRCGLRSYRRPNAPLLACQGRPKHCPWGSTAEEIG